MTLYSLKWYDVTHPPSQKSRDLEGLTRAHENYLIAAVFQFGCGQARHDEEPFFPFLGFITCGR